MDAEFETIRDNIARFLLKVYDKDLNGEGEWKDEALCRGLPSELFFGEELRIQKFRKDLPCDNCPVRMECGEYGYREHFGIWGNFSQRERRRLFSKTRKKMDVL